MAVADISVSYCKTLFLVIVLCFSAVPLVSALDMPRIIYGTAWKKDETQRLVVEALQLGFRAIDVACQPKHYNEPAVGRALEQLFNEQWLTRGDIFLQSKFTAPKGQDAHNMPYDKHAPLADQVRQSFAASLRNLKTDYLDSLLLHSPLPSFDKTLSVYRIFEDLHRAGQVRNLGISNCYDVETLRALWEAAEVKPAFVQNRFYLKTNFDKDVRAYCAEKHIIYQSFWTLTANREFIRGPLMHALAVKYAKTPEQLFYAFVRSLGGVPLSGTTSQQHMRDDLEVMGHSTGSGYDNTRRHEDHEDGSALVLDTSDVARIREGLQMT